MTFKEYVAGIDSVDDITEKLESTSLHQLFIFTASLPIELLDHHELTRLRNAMISAILSCELPTM